MVCNWFRYLWCLQRRELPVLEQDIKLKPFFQTTTLAYRSKSIEGPWTRQIVQSDLTCGGQSMGILEIPAIGKQDTQYIYHSDAVSMSPSEFLFQFRVHFRLKHATDGLRWGSAHGHDFFQLEFKGDGSIKPLSCSPQKSFTIQAPRGDVTLPTSGRAINASDASDNFGSCECIGPARQAIIDVQYRHFCQQLRMSSKSAYRTTLIMVSRSLQCPSFKHGLLARQEHCPKLV